MVEAGEVVVEVQEYMAEVVAVEPEMGAVVAERLPSNSRTVFLDNDNCTVYVCVYHLIALLR